MIVDERMTSFIRSFEKTLPDGLELMEEEAIKDQVPIIRKEVQSFLKVLLMTRKPMRILEIGTAVGFSSLFMSQWISKDAKIITIENYERRIKKAKENISKMGKQDQIHLLEGDAGEWIYRLTGTFDMIFLDGPKGQYPLYLERLIQLLNTDGLLISDNVLQEGELIQSHYVVERRQRTIHKRMRQYLYRLTHHPCLETSILPLGDGMTISVKKERNEEK